MLLILLLAFWLRVFALSQESYWFDEVHSIQKAQAGGVRAIWEALRGDVHPPFYFWLLSWWLQWFGAGEFGARFLSVLCGVGSIAALYAWGRELHLPRRACLIAIFLLAISPHAIWYSQQARMYALLVFLGV